MASKEYKLVEMVLKNYHFLKDLIEMETEINNLKGMRYRHTTSEGNNNSDSTQDAALSKIERDTDILKINVLVNFIEKAMKRLSELEQKTIEEYYINQNNWNVVAKSIPCSIRHCQRKRRSGINRLSKMLIIDEMNEYFSLMSKLLSDSIMII